MNEITTVRLENEMDLILANRQSMKLCELVGLGLPSQTTFATAVSEIARTALERSSRASLSLNISDPADREKYIISVVRDLPGKVTEKQKKGYDYARKLVNSMDVTNNDLETLIELRFRIPGNMRLDVQIAERIRMQMAQDPAVSPYEEIKRKNKHLLELSDMLAKSEYRYKDLTNSLPLHIFSVNAEGKLTYANHWLIDYTGRSIEELNSSRWDDILHIDDIVLARQAFNEGVENGTSATYQVRMKHVTGEYRWHSGAATPVMDEKGDVILFHTYLADIHAQKMVEDALKDNKALKEVQQVLEEKIAELNNSNQQLEQFAYIASHDLQEPLRKIGFYSDLLKSKHRNELDEDANKLIDNITRSSDRMKTLVHDILAYSTLTENKEIYQLQDLNKVAQEAMTDLELLVNEKNAIVTIDPLFSIKGNGQQLKQLFENLLSNSLKFVEKERQPEITITAEETADFSILRFKDNGIGFELRYLDKMFHLFQRLHTRDKFSGTGIGLAICKKIVMLHGGEITATSVPGEGAEFIISFPKA